MPNVPASNISTKLYCPKCGSFNMKRFHRGYVKKNLFKQPAQYICLACKEKQSRPTISNNEVKEVPMFIAD